MEEASDSIHERTRQRCDRFCLRKRMVSYLHAYDNKETNSFRELKMNLLKQTRQTRTEYLFHGLLVSILADDGPKCVLNATELDETTVIRMTVAGMTAFGMGNGTTHLHKLHGPLPIPEHPHLNYLAYYFRISGKDSSDTRIQRFGRDAVIFLVFDNRYRNEIFELYLDIERAFQETLHSRLTTEDLVEGNILLEIIGKIKQEIRVHRKKQKGEVRSPTSDDVVEGRQAERRIPRHPPVVEKMAPLPQQLQAALKELSEIQDQLERMLTLTNEVPIIKERKVEPNIDARDKPSIDVLKDRLFSWLDEHEGELNLVRVRDSIDTDLLIKLGNWYFWYGLLLDSSEGFQKAIESYLRAGQFKKDPELWLAIGASYIRLGNEDEGKSWIKEGLKKTAELQKVIPIDKRMLFAK